TTNKERNYGPFGIVHENFSTMSQPFIKLSEVIFLRAEGALRGWAMGGTAQEFYEKGIRLMFEENKVYAQGGELDNYDVDAYIN
ncbi:SusD/RagB family nutrient-binding outer membrane lipoprotein, partial [Muribaculum intestinale]|uniref:SusD/RagB family nutrient-binding outer membrane lipoprotein n=3 Tax=Bacteroidales TaxID=171549 RepID=UPI00259D00BF